MRVNETPGTIVEQGYSPTDRPKGIEGAAASFEALFIGNLLKSVREASQGSLGGEGDRAGSTMMDVAEEYLANDIAKGGGLGLAKLVASQFASHYSVSVESGGPSDGISAHRRATGVRPSQPPHPPSPQNEH